jgi:Domain of unknown function (DUF4440)
MRRLLMIAVILVLTSSASFAQRPGRILTPTRFVTIFSNLENQLTDALVANNSAAAAGLLAEDFSQWTPQPPGSPVPREEWLKSAGKGLANFRIRQMSAKDLGDHVAVSFVLTTGAKAFFIVDIWQKAGTDWQLATRYLSPVDPAPFRGDIRPTGKN